MAAPGTGIGSGPGALPLSQPDIKAVGDFMRDFVVMSMIPWMEKCVMEWNDAVRDFYHSIRFYKQVDNVIKVFLI